MPEQASDGLKVYTKEEAAKILRVKVSWLERRAAARQIPFTMLSGSYRFTDAHLAEIVRINEQGMISPPATPINRRRQRARTDARKRPDGFIPLRPRPKASA
ncbi:hypothetical protein [Spirillospora sp. NPDC029432]|uniref:helix-turn-helix domain-containing protein n=1 Tax=Spirillospora sp. NPDC029432 TaxID=3154599 RepID=UPI003454DDEF